MKRTNIIVGFIGVTFSLVIYLAVIPREISELTTHYMSPAFFPKVLTAILGLASLYLIFLNLVGWAVDEETELQGASIQSKINLFPFIVILIVVAYILLFRPMGFLVVTAGCVVTIMLAFRERSFLRILIVTVVTTGVIYIVFDKIMLLVLPKGLITWW